ncbi:AtpZ/AtpI family protein [Marinirhabdus gelatinilytica]|uniref:Putative F0F1-ATPase subunit (Ca2+/Mg2+ transporter) n=1 Tax=Marinirhabdus gelatinilytica TaxID=1703343 RepID=A0A370QJJ7_9FLAO|nr:AtpZ/AtpI family protein [Marinirhabdus gelatinilytica]RDK88543.1 putative F0F1-ATPase subunit (Ca2+/Mg2+ transporter) [Marinirhabdus gelatinilytica]
MANNTPSGLKRWLVLTAIGLEMGVVIYLFVQLGKWLDTTYGAVDSKTYLIICTLAGVAISLFLVLKQTNRLNRD